jgi:hypothetical protein
VDILRERLVELTFRWKWRSVGGDLIVESETNEKKWYMVSWVQILVGGLRRVKGKRGDLVEKEEIRDELTDEIQ